MMKAIILCEDPRHPDAVYAEPVMSRLKKLTSTDGKRYTKADILADPDKFSSVEFIFSTWGMPCFTEKEIHEFLPKLKCVFYAAGSVQWFARPFLNCGIKVFSAWAANAVPVAEYTVAQIILAGKDFYCQTRLLAENNWQEAENRRGGHTGNYHKKIGLIGCGMIGSMVAERLKAHDFDVMVYDPYLSEEKANQLGVSLCSLNEIFSECSVVSNHLANNDATQKILRYEHFYSMPKYAVFLNTGRGAQVDENGLVKALTERPDLTAVLDVTDPEPSPHDHSFYTLPNCFLTPHIAGSLGTELVRMSEYMVNEYEKYAKGEPCQYEVTLKMLETMA